jgi:diguanylate cyclase (GGDEF)-like protein
MIHSVLGGATGLVSLCIYFAGVGTGIYALMFVWVVAVAASFFSHKAVATHVVWICLAWGLALSLVQEPTPGMGFTRWLLGAFVLTVSAFVIIETVAGRRSTEQRLRRLQLEFEHLAHHDPLTDIPNRRLFELEFDRELARAARRGTPLCVVAVDLNEFKKYNDRNGHAAGDELLKSATDAWVGGLRTEDLIARLGGDEFIALLPDCPLTKAEEVAQRLCGSVPLNQTCSTGVACWNQTELADELLTRADEALYETKTRHRARALAETVQLGPQTSQVASIV